MAESTPFCGAGVPPAFFAVCQDGKIAGETPAPQQLGNLYGL
jgi:hypothetical protein